MSDKLAQINTLSLTVIEGLQLRPKRLMELLPSVGDMMALAAHRVTIDTVVTLKKVFRSSDDLKSSLTSFATGCLLLLQTLETLAAPFNLSYQAPAFAVPPNLSDEEAMKLQSTRLTLHQTAWMVLAKLASLRQRVESCNTLEEAVEVAKLVRTVKQSLPDLSASGTLPVSTSLSSSAEEQPALPRPPSHETLAVAATTTSSGATVSGFSIAANDVRDDYADKPWFFVNLTRTTAEQMLAGKPPGSFVVRPASIAGWYAAHCCHRASRPFL